MAYREIEALIYSYAEKIDSGDFDSVAALFADAVYRADGGLEFRGADAVAKVLRAVVLLHDGVPATKHVTTNVQLEVTGDEATARSYFTVFQAVGDLALQPIVAGRYHDRFARVEGKWRFRERTVSMDLVGDVSRHLRFDPQS